MAMSNAGGAEPLGIIPLDFELDIGTVVDIDFDPSIIDEAGLRKIEVSDEGDEQEDGPLRPEHFLSIQGTAHGQALFAGQRRLPLPEQWSNPDFPFVRSLPNGNILISDTGFELASGKNTWILSSDGAVVAHFGIGSAAVDVFGLGDGMIAAAYHPMSAKRFGHRIEPQQRTAIAFFDHEGRLISSFNHQASRQNISADNVRCMTRISNTELLFAPEKCISEGQNVENPIILFNYDSKESTVFSMPYGSPEAVSLHQTADGVPWILLASPEGFEDQVIAFDPARKISHYLGAFVGIFRGLAVPSQYRYGRTLQTGTSKCGGLVCGGFLAQEFAAGYDWVAPSAGELEVYRTDEQADKRTVEELEYVPQREAGPDLS